MQYLLRDVADQSVRLVLRDSSNNPVTTLTNGSSGLTIDYLRKGAAATASVTPAALAAIDSVHSDGGFKHMFSGEYRVDLPDAAAASGTSLVTVAVAADGVLTQLVHVPIFDFDPVEDVSISNADMVSIAAQVKTTLGMYEKNVAVTGFMFHMSTTAGAAGTGLTVTATVSLDGGAFAGVAAAISEVSGGWYKVDIAQGEMNADEVALRFTATGARDTNIKIRTTGS